MPLAAGTRLGPYEILAPLGAGGMGEVYRARDTKLDRDVAIKVLPATLAQDAERLARFEREAKVLASLNHPNIAQIYGVEDRALIMELVAGETLKGPLPLDTALDYARQIADALEAAHEKGIVHRDLKPANIMITPAGVVKVLDFGLAAVALSRASGSDPANSPTLTMQATQAGMILGTAAYMAPEQARGKAVDKRADIWAFGVVLCEMVIGTRVFDGEDVAETLAAVIHKEPDLMRLPLQVRGVVERCLRKDPRRRIRDIGDVQMALEEGATEAKVETRVAPRPLWKRAIPVLGAAILAAAIAGALVWRFKPAPPLAITRFPVTLGAGQNFSFGLLSVLAMSPDGSQMVYAASDHLYLRSMADPEARAIPGIEGSRDSNPVFSPDGRSIAFWSGGDSTIKRVAVSGGTAVTICQAAVPSGMTWSSDGIVFAGDQGILRVSPNGGKPELIAASQNGEILAHPEILPGGKAVLFTLANGSTSTPAWDRAKIVVQTLKTGVRKTLIDGGSSGRSLPTGHIVYALGGTLFVVPFDLRRLEVKGGPVPTVEGVRRGPVIGVTMFSFSRTGTLAFVPGPASVSSTESSLALIDPKGGVELLKLPPGPYLFPRVSRDGKHVAYETDDGKESIIWIYDLSGASSPRRLTFQGANRYPVWSADGERVAFQSDREGDLGIFMQRTDGTGTAERLTKPEKGVLHIPDSFSPDGQQLLFTAVQGRTAGVWTFSLREKKATVFTEGPSSFSSWSVFSPDGRWVAYQSHESGQVASNQIYVRPFPATETKYQILNRGNTIHPLWSPDGNELLYIPAPGQFAAVTVTREPGFTFSSPTAVPRGGFSLDPNSARNYDILPDRRIVGVVSAGQPQAGSTPQIQVVLNWFEDLKQRVPVR